MSLKSEDKSFADCKYFAIVSIFFITFKCYSLSSALIFIVIDSHFNFYYSYILLYVLFIFALDILLLVI